MTLLTRLISRHPQRQPEPEAPAQPPIPEPQPLRTVPEQHDPEFFTRVASQWQSRGEDNRLAAHGESGGWLHLSNILDMCPRQIVLAGSGGGVGVNHIRTDPGTRIIWAIGRAVEHELRTSFIAGHGGHLVFGSWACPCGATCRTYTFGDPSITCPVCGHGLGYREAPLRDQTLRIVGNPDLLFRTSPTTPVEVVEIKSIRKEDFERLRAPQPAHVYQACGYRKLAQIEGRQVAEHVRIVYACKQAVRGSPYKEFVVSGENPAVAGRLRAVWGAVEELRRHQAAGTLPGRVCGDVAAGARRACPLVTDCFLRG